MPTLTYGQQQAFCETVVQFFRDNLTDLKKLGLDPTKKLEELEKTIRSVFELDIQQETARANQKGATIKMLTALRAAYGLASSLIEAAIGMYGKSAPISQRLRKLREQMVNVALRGKRVAAS